MDRESSIKILCNRKSDQNFDQDLAPHVEQESVYCLPFECRLLCISAGMVLFVLVCLFVCLSVCNFMQKQRCPKRVQ